MWIISRARVVAKVQFAVNTFKVILGHKGRMRFLPLTSYRNEVEQMRMVHCVQLVNSNYLMCILIFSCYPLLLTRAALALQQNAPSWGRGGKYYSPLPNSRISGLSEVGEATIESFQQTFLMGF